jgi:hypothetical protein
MLHTALEAIGFDSITDDDNIYSNNFNKCTAAIFIPIYVNDPIIASKGQSTIDTTIYNLNKTFNVHSLGSIS